MARWAGRIVLAVFTLLVSLVRLAVCLPAFPGAEGFGSETPGGRGGRVIEVTNLNDAGPGSLRQAIAVETGPRIVVFRVGGDILLQSPIILERANSFLTIAGQTAPGDGIALRHYGIQLRGGVHDVVLRYLRIRPGTANPSGIGGHTIDGLGMWGNEGSHVYNVIVDHVSLTWAVDENADCWEWVTGVTYQWCLFAEGSETGHPNGPHSMGLLMGGDDRITVSVHHSLFAHNNDRNPLFGGKVADFRNNVIYNWVTVGTATFRRKAQVNFINNHYLKGPTSPVSDLVVALKGEPRLYLRGNWTPLCPSGCLDDAAIGIYRFSPRHRVFTPFPAPFVSTHPTFRVQDVVLPRAGATFPKRDAVDARIVNEVITRTGRVGIGSGYPELKSGSAPVDSDHDGMPDVWELQRGLNPHDGRDRNHDADGDGYTAVEEYLNGLVEAVAP